MKRNSSAGRPPVAEDVRQEKISPAKARELYGVVLHASGHALDIEATRVLRAALGDRSCGAAPAATI